MPATLAHVARIWDAADHNAFTDLIRWHDTWWCTFREAYDHVGGDGRIRVLTSTGGTHWTSAALIDERGIDLRDPKLTITPDDRLMIVACGTVYDGDTWRGRQPRVMFSSDGYTWSAPERVQADGDWLWSLIWHNGRAYGVTYRTPGDEWTTTLVSSVDGRHFEDVSTFDVRGWPNETALRVMPDGEMMAFLRRDGGNRAALVGRSRAPYTEWTWRETVHRIGGPNLIRLPDGDIWAGGRCHFGGLKTVLGRLTFADGFSPELALPSAGDTGYPGLVWHEGRLWVSYYASHEGKAAIYLAQVTFD